VIQLGLFAPEIFLLYGKQEKSSACDGCTEFLR